MLFHNITFLMYFYQINAALGNIIDFFQKHLIILIIPHTQDQIWSKYPYALPQT